MLVPLTTDESGIPCFAYRWKFRSRDKPRKLRPRYARSGRHSLSDYVPSIPIITHSSRFSGLAQCHLPLTLEPHAGVPFFDYQTALSISNLAFYRTRRLLLSSDGPWTVQRHAKSGNRTETESNGTFNWWVSTGVANKIAKWSNFPLKYTYMNIFLKFYISHTPGRKFWKNVILES